MTQEHQVKEVTKEEVGQWRDHPVTRALLADMVSRQTEAAQIWANKGYQRETAEATAMANSEALGGMQVLQSMVEFLRGEQA